MAYSFSNTQKSSSDYVHIDASKSSLQGGENIESFSWKVIARLEQLLNWFQALGDGTGKVTNATNADNATTATKLSNTSAIGSTTAPVYFNASGQPVVCGSSLAVNITGNAATATTATTAASCTGNAATATSATSCTGNAATATSAASCTGNAATATKATYDANGNNIATTLSNCKITSSGSNYVVFGNGLKICWGSFGGGSFTVSVSTTFSNTNYSVAIFNSSGMGHEHQPRLTSKTKTTFTYSNSNYSQDKLPFNWIAIGF